MTGLEMRRRAMIGAKKTRLPVAYQEIKFLESKGKQYIVTGFSPTRTTTVHVITSIVYNGDSNPVVGTRTGNNNYNRFFPIANNTSSFIRLTLGASQILIASLYGFDKINDIWFNVLNENNEEISVVNGTIKTGLRRSSYTKANDNPLCFFGTVGYDDNHWESKARIYIVEVFEQNILVGKFIPCYRKSDNKPGLYDLCGSICPLTNSPFFVNAGTGEFTLGPEV